jgi:hypothetical protein
MSVERQLAGMRQAVSNMGPSLAQAVSSQLAMTETCRSLRQQLGRPLEMPERLETLCVTWGGADTFPAHGPKETDHYFGPLPGLLHQGGEEPGFLVNPLDWVHDFGDIAANAIRYEGLAVLAPECIDPGRFQQRCAAFLSQEPKLANGLVLGGVDVSDLFVFAVLEERLRTAYPIALRSAEIGPFFQQAGTRVGQVIFPYENQPLEKGLRHGFKASQPETALIGYFHAPFSRMWLGAFPGQQSAKLELLPDYLAMPGTHWRELMASHGFPEERLLAWPAFRFGHLETLRATPPSVGEGVLVALPMDGQECLENLLLVLPAAQVTPDIAFALKFHPALDGPMGPEQLLPQAMELTHLPALPGNIRVVDRPVADLLPEHAALLSGGSSVEFEAAASGLPTIFMGSRLRIDMNVLPLEEHTARVRQPAELVAVLKAVLGRNTPRTPWDRERLERYFLPLSAGLELPEVKLEQTAAQNVAN